MAPSFRTLLLLVGLLTNGGISQLCTIPPRPASELVDDPSFEQGDLEWGISGPGNEVSTIFPAHSGTHVNVMRASYIKSSGTAATKTTSYTQQNVPAFPGRTYAFSAFYKIQTFSKGSSCPNAAYPQTACSLAISYAFQTITIIPITATTGSYIQFSTPFLPSTGGRYIQFDLRCDAPTTTPTPETGCAETTLLLDDVTFYDKGWDCSWRYWGCFSDNVDSRSLPVHGAIPGWPATTTVEACCNACADQGYWYAGLEYGNECWCGNGLGGVNQTVGDGGCDMRCEGFNVQTCGGADRLSVYHQAVWP